MKSLAFSLLLSTITAAPILHGLSEISNAVAKNVDSSTHSVHEFKVEAPTIRHKSRKTLKIVRARKKNHRKEYLFEPKLLTIDEVADESQNWIVRTDNQVKPKGSLKQNRPVDRNDLDVTLHRKVHSPPGKARPTLPRLETGNLERSEVTTGNDLSPQVPTRKKSPKLESW